MRIKSYAGGGISYLPTTNRRREAASQEAASPSSKISEYTKAVLNMLQKQEGLDSDMTILLDDIDRALTMAASNPMSMEFSMKDITRLVRTASLVSTNYKDYIKTRDALDSQDA